MGKRQKRQEEDVSPGDGQTNNGCSKKTTELMTWAVTRPLTQSEGAAEAEGVSLCYRIQANRCGTAAVSVNPV